MNGFNQIHAIINEIGSNYLSIRLSLWSITSKTTGMEMTLIYTGIISMITS